MPGRRRNALVVVASLGVAIAFAELAMFSALRFPRFRARLDGTYFSGGAFSGEVSRFDPVRGYRWSAGGFAGLRLLSGEVVIDARYHADDRGFARTRSFPMGSPPHPRLAVFGDSFSEGMYLERNWMSEANLRLEGRAAKGAPELVSYAVDGGGLANWVRLLRDGAGREEGAVLAVFGDDLLREFSVSATRDGVYHFARSAELHDADDVVRKGCALAMVLEPRQFRWMQRIGRGEARFGENLLRFLELSARRLAFRRASARCGADSMRSLDEPRSEALLKELVTAFRREGKRVILAALPARETLVRYLRTGEEPDEVRRLRGKAEVLGIEWFDGYRAFAEAKPPGADPAAFVAALWLRHDGHWNQKGSDLFGSKMAEYLLLDRPLRQGAGRPAKTE